MHDVRVRAQTLVVPGFLHTPVPLTAASEAMSRTLDRILATILVALYLQKRGLMLGDNDLVRNDKYGSKCMLTNYCTSLSIQPIHGMICYIFFLI